MRFFDAQRNSRDCGRAASSSPCGGGFGAKMHVYCEELLVCVLAKLLDRSVRWIETRPEHVVATVHAREIVHDVEVATEEQGRMLALRALTGDTDRGSRTAGLRARSLMTEPHAELWTAKSTAAVGAESSRRPETHGWVDREWFLLRRPRGDATVTLRLGPGIPASIQTHEVETVAP